MARIVGAQGAGVNKIRDTLGVKVDFSDDHDDKEKDAGKKKKSAAGQKVKVKVRIDSVPFVGILLSFGISDHWT